MPLRDYFFKLYQLLMPYHCILCSNPAKQQDLCLACKKNLPVLSHACIKCARPLTMDGLTCGYCLQYPPPWTKGFSVFIYQQPIIQLITDLKFRQQLTHARLLAELLTESITTQWYQHHPLPECLIPIPLSKQRLQERGFNQTLEIAKLVSKRLRIPIDLTSERIKHTKPQAGIPETERKQNIKNAFQINRIITSSHVAVLDDVITTGYTMREFCQQLRQAGARDIDVWGIARPQMYS